ncbi:DUF1810 domain-containing protein [Dactylosporangium matsuzakiense]|uniref:Calpastatin n=1 Tax=Dactylosporangium matsuzakiense TaxID=53360 RepID=A0A9W6KIG2_9ACTN|nr:DUF1810 domain-containing protein [Dactylosporangium matsuzakiense]UWZ48904.1 DUF1810 domain-containing protein [Dactylosporangium matsuzakiense]GLL00876.1 hypothetical protein GCM10017581_026170 [Dactylosporangium matsuzakiense]
MEDPYGLSRFVEAQRDVYDHAIGELKDGNKRSHWMWFVFPQIRGLGRSSTAQRYAIGSLAEARAYLQHPVLGPRLLECTDALLGDSTHTAEDIFGATDAMKLRSSMTLFAHAEPAENRFARVLDRYYGGIEDAETLRRI